MKLPMKLSVNTLSKNWKVKNDQVNYGGDCYVFYVVDFWCFDHALVQNKYRLFLDCAFSVRNFIDLVPIDFIC